jgi:hypothetical protein
MRPSIASRGLTIERRLLVFVVFGTRKHRLAIWLHVALSTECRAEAAIRWQSWDVGKMCLTDSSSSLLLPCRRKLHQPGILTARHGLGSGALQNFRTMAPTEDTFSEETSVPALTYVA